MSARTAAVWVLFALFLLGGAAGCLAAGAVSGGSGEALLNELRACLTLPDGGAGYFDALWQAARAPLAVFLLGFTAFGVVAIPAVFFARGFLLSYAIAVCYRFLGLGGLPAALVLFALGAPVWLPVMLRLGEQGMSGSASVLRRLRGDAREPLRLGHSYFLRFGVCAVALCLCAAAERAFIPILLRAVSGVLPAGLGG